MSKRHAKALVDYFKVRREYLAKNYSCEAGPIIAAAKMPHGYHRPVCNVWADQVHHTAGRGPNLCNVETFCATCAPCHEFIHSHGQWSRAHGLLT